MLVQNSISSVLVGAEYEEIRYKNLLFQMALDASIHGIMITDSIGKAVLHNRYLLSLFDLPDYTFEGEDSRWQEMMSRRFREPARLLHFLELMPIQPGSETLDIFELVDGRLVECRTRCQYMDLLKDSYRIWSFIDCTEQQRRERELHRLSTYDTMTGAYNRAYFDMQLRMLRPSSFYPVSMIMIDVDGLKQVNDHRGHPAGDDMLRRAVQILRHACRPEDVVSRLGGDEFAVLLLQADDKVCEQVATRIQGLLNIYNIRNTSRPLSLSLGFASAQNAQELDTLVTRADEIMYEERRVRRAKND